jgi:von Willebrand factor type C domain
MRSAWFRGPGRTLGAYLVVGLLAIGCGSGDPEPTTCEYDGKRHELGDMFPAGDGCNRCTCSQNETVVCSKNDCTEDCEYGGESHAPGETFASTDGCNSCTCETNGDVSCTEIACGEDGCRYQGRFYAEGETFMAADGCNTCRCGGGTVGCTQRDCPSPTCEFNGMRVPVGAKFPTPDGCNVCACVGPDRLDCTQQMCFLCYYEGINYEAGDKFTASDGCSECSCQGGGGIYCDSSKCPTDSCNFGAAWYEKGESVLCPDGCNTCICDGANSWRSEDNPIMCRARFAELCMNGPGDEVVEASFVYRAADSLVIETEAEACTASYVLCFRQAEASADPVPIDLWLVETPGVECDDPRTQFAFDLSQIRNYLGQINPGKPPVASLELNGDSLIYSY